MGNKSSLEEAKGAGKDVIKQTEKTSHEFYELADLANGGRLVQAYRRAQSTKDFSEVNDLIEGLQKFLYQNGEGKKVPVSDLIVKRRKTRVSEIKKLEQAARSKWRGFHGMCGCCAKCCRRQRRTTRVHDANRMSVSMEPLTPNTYTFDETAGPTSCTFRHVCWDIEQTGAVGENLLHLCFLNATRVHYELAKKIIKRYPAMVNDIYLSDEYYGESNIHMAIVNKEFQMLHYLCSYGADVHERAYGAFFCPEDQRNDREDDMSHEGVILKEDTNYHGNIYYGEYPLSFAACLDEYDMVKYLLHRNACPNKQDTNGNTVLHMMVIHKKPDMYDFLREYPCYCGCCQKARTDIKNKQKLTPLTLAAKLGHIEMFHHILNQEREVFWKYGEVTCAAFPLKDLDTVGPDGKILEESALSIIIYEVGSTELLEMQGTVEMDGKTELLKMDAITKESKNHLDLLDGIIHNMLKEKWKLGCRFRFHQLLALYILYLLVVSVALYLRPVGDPNCVTTQPDVVFGGNVTMSNVFNGSFTNTTLLEECDPCYLRSSIYLSTKHQVRGAFEILANLMAFLYIFIIIHEMVVQGFKTIFWSLVHNPLRGLFAVSCFLLPGALVCRFTCYEPLEDYLTVIALTLAWPYSLMFCRGFSLTGSFVVMIYRMIKKDFIVFIIIFLIFVIGFSQAMFLVTHGYVDPDDPQHMFSRWFASGLAHILMSLGGFQDLVEQLLDFDTPYKILGLIMFIGYLVINVLLTVNMLIAMMGNTYLAVAETRKEWTRQWSTIVLAMERMLNPKQRLAMQRAYSQPLTSTGERALVMRLHKHEDYNQSKVTHDPTQQHLERQPPLQKDEKWLN